MISGSHYSVYEPHQWIAELKEFLREVVARHPDIRILGGCFGHQVLVEALGGRVGKNPSGKFVFATESLTVRAELEGRVDFQEALHECGLSGGSAVGRLRVIESHGDQALELPPGATVLAESATAPYEMWALGDQVLAWQGHPEMDRGSALNKIFPFVRDRLASPGGLSLSLSVGLCISLPAGHLTRQGEEADASQASVRESAVDADVLLAMARRFLRVV